MLTNIELNYIISEVQHIALKLFTNSLKNVILYGSYARGDFDGGSDVDIMLVVDVPATELSRYSNEIYGLASRLSMETEQCTTVSVALQDMATYIHYRDYLPFFRNISAEGVVIYAA